MTKALLIIDLQNDYFPDGAFPLWNTEKTVANIELAIAQFHNAGAPILHIQHLADSRYGISPFFNEGTSGAAIYPKIIQAAPNAPIIIKHFADSFYETDLENQLNKLGVTEIVVCGMMTQNCVTHTAISKSAEKYKVSILMDCCTTVTELLHNIALHAVSTRMKLITLDKLF